MTTRVTMLVQVTVPSEYESSAVAWVEGLTAGFNSDGIAVLNVEIQSDGIDRDWDPR